MSPLSGAVPGGPEILMMLLGQLLLLTVPLLGSDFLYSLMQETDRMANALERLAEE